MSHLNILTLDLVLGYTMQILSAIVHSIQKESKTNQANLVPRSDCFDPEDEILVSFARSLLKVYAEEANTWGKIDKGGTAQHMTKPPSQFHTCLLVWHGEQTLEAYKAFSLQLGNLIKENIEDSHLATGGYMLLLHYQDQNKSYLMVVMLKLADGYTINNEDLSFRKTVFFNMKNFHEAARISLDIWQDVNESGNCISFVRRRGKDQDDATRYLRKSLGCIDYAESTSNTKKLVKALEAYMISKEMGEDAKKETKSRAYEYLSRCIKDKSSVDLKVFSSTVSNDDDDEEQSEFYTFIKDNNYEICDRFKPNKKYTDKLHRICAKIGTTSINFDVDDLDETVFYDPTTRQITVKGVSQEIHTEIMKAKGCDSIN